MPMRAPTCASSTRTRRASSSAFAPPSAPPPPAAAAARAFATPSAAAACGAHTRVIHRGQFIARAGRAAYGNAYRRIRKCVSPHAETHSRTAVRPASSSRRSRSIVPAIVPPAASACARIWLRIRESRAPAAHGKCKRAPAAHGKCKRAPAAHGKCKRAPAAHGKCKRAPATHGKCKRACAHLCRPGRRALNLRPQRATRRLRARLPRLRSDVRAGISARIRIRIST